MSIYLIILAVVAVLVIWFIAIYNRLVILRKRVKEAFSDIDIQLKRRFDLIPNLVSAVKGYMAHEQSVLENITKARASVQSAGSSAERSKAEGELTNTLKTLFAVAENYPDLKANQNFLELQKEITDTENKIQASRRFYNANVRDLNIQIHIFPAMIIASMLHIKDASFFEMENVEERKNVQVTF